MGDETYTRGGSHQENILRGNFGSTNISDNLMEEPNEDQYEERVFEDFETANQPLYDGCVKGLVLMLKSILLSKKYGRETYGVVVNLERPSTRDEGSVVACGMPSFNTTTERTNSMMKST
ncbi:unnamed protein product [Cochlearia groenlandica]